MHALNSRGGRSAPVPPCWACRASRQVTLGFPVRGRTTVGRDETRCVRIVSAMQYSASFSHSPSLRAPVWCGVSSRWLFWGGVGGCGKRWGFGECLPGPYHRLHPGGSLCLDPICRKQVVEGAGRSEEDLAHLKVVKELCVPPRVPFTGDLEPCNDEWKVEASPVEGA
jgi:hypothetical protein